MSARQICARVQALATLQKSGAIDIDTFLRMSKEVQEGRAAPLQPVEFDDEEKKNERLSAAGGPELETCDHTNKAST